MFEQYLGPDAKRHQIEALLQGELVRGEKALAEELSAKADPSWLNPANSSSSRTLATTACIFIIVGVFDVVINGQLRAKRGREDSVGEMAAVQPTQKRSANVVAFG